MSSRFSSTFLADVGPKTGFPGQNGLFSMPLGLGDRSWTLTRASATTIGITVKLGAQSRGASEFLHRSCKVGSKLLLKSVQGEFSPFFKNRQQQHKGILFLTAGIGITPALAAVRHPSASAKINVLHFDRSESDHFAFWNEIQRGSNKAVLLTHPNRPLLSKELLLRFFGPDVSNWSVFVCGPCQVHGRGIECAARARGN